MDGLAGNPSQCMTWEQHLIISPPRGKRIRTCRRYIECYVSDCVNLNSHPRMYHSLTQAPGVSRYYTATSSYSPGDAGDNGIILSIDQEVEVIGINQYGWWWVRATNPRRKDGFQLAILKG